MHIATLWKKNINAVINGEYDIEKLITHATAMGLSENDLEKRITEGDIPTAYILSLIHI